MITKKLIIMELEMLGGSHFIILPHTEGMPDSAYVSMGHKIVVVSESKYEEMHKQQGQALMLQLDLAALCYPRGKKDGQ